MRRLGPFDEGLRFGAAHQFWIRCLLAGVDVRYTEQILLLLRRHQDQMTAPARGPANALDADKLLVPFLEKLSPAPARRIRMARMLISWRSMAWNRGPGTAARYWANAPMHPGRFDLRVFAYFLLDTAASRAPQDLGLKLRMWALRLLLGGAANTGTNGTTPTLDRNCR